MPEKIVMSREHLLGMRESKLHAVDIIERALNISPRTSELRKSSRHQRFQQSQKSQTAVVKPEHRSRK